MIIFNLGKLLGERNLKISKIYADTGISRSTLTKMVNNDNDMVRLSTIDTLCNYLKVTPNELFEYAPLEMNVKVVVNDIGFEGSSIDIDVFIELKDYRKNKITKFDYSIYEGFEELPDLYENIYSSWTIFGLDLKQPYQLIEYVKRETNNSVPIINNILTKISNEVLNEINVKYQSRGISTVQFVAF